MRHRPEHEVGDPGEVVLVAGEERQIVGDRDGGDQRIERPSLRLATGLAERGRDPAERPGSRRIECQGFEGDLDLLESSLTRGTLLRVVGHQRADRQLDEGDGGDGRVIGQDGRVEPAEQDDGVGVEDALWVGAAHND